MLGLKGDSLVVLETIGSTTTNEQVGVEHPVSFVFAKVSKIQKEIDATLSIVEFIKESVTLVIGESTFTLPTVEVDAGTYGSRELPADVKSCCGRNEFHKLSLTNSVSCATLKLEVPVRIELIFVLCVHHKSDKQQSNN